MKKSLFALSTLLTLSFPSLTLADIGPSYDNLTEKGEDWFLIGFIILSIVTIGGVLVFFVKNCCKKRK